VQEAMARFGAIALGRTDNPYHELIPAVLAQRVTAREALWQWSQVCLRWGEEMSLGSISLRTPPTADRLLSIPLHEWHLLGVERRRAETARHVARHAPRLLAGWRPELPVHERTASLQLIPGVGEWTAAVAGHCAFGDPDALEFGDFHVKNTVAWALSGRPRGTDDEMRLTMEPYAGERRRVLTWLSLAGWSAPARGPKRRNLDIARL
jgi:3-methyladenine DNA glycosylase/8-oxoguanine DNA glycosylase